MDFRSERRISWRKGRILAGLVLIFLLGVLILREAAPSQPPFQPLQAEAVNAPAHHSGRLPRVRDFDFSTSPANNEINPFALISTNGASVVADAPAEIDSASTSPASFDARLPAPELKLAIADFPKIFNAWYRTKLARAEFADWKGDAAARDRAMTQRHEQLVAELKQVILSYSVAHDLDAVFDSGTVMATSGAPLIVYARPGLDITEGVIALANAGHATN